MKSLFRRPSRNAHATRVFYATDLHGSDVTWRKFINGAKFYGADVLICGGDLMGKVVVPIIREGSDKWRASLQGQSHELRGTEQLEEFKRKLSTLGHYMTEVDVADYEDYLSDDEKIANLFDQLATERLHQWVELAEERLAGTHVRCLLTGGNDDTIEVLARLESMGTEHVVPCEGKVVPLDDHHTVASLGYSTPTPWNTPRELPDEAIGGHIATLLEGIEDPTHCIFNFHAPPLDSGLDTCIQLDTSVWPPAPVTRHGQPVYYGAGSRSVRDAVQQYHPVVGLHGHIHESRGIQRFDGSPALNPGSEYSEGILRGAIVTISDGAMKGVQFTSG